MRGIDQFLMAAVCAAGVTLAAADFSVAKLEDYNIGKQTGFAATADGFSYKAPKGCRMEILSKAMLPVSLDKKYRFEGSVRLPEGCAPSGYFWIGLKSFDKEGKEISVTACNGLPGTMTELAKAVKPGDKEIFLKDASKWKVEYTHVAFDAKADWSDIPNNALSPSVKSIDKAGNEWKLTLVQPMTKAYPAGTAVRYHRDGATYIYLYCTQPKAEWGNFKAEYKGVFQTNAINNAGKFRPKTAKVQMILFCEGGKPCFAEFKGLKVTEVK